MNLMNGICRLCGEKSNAMIGIFDQFGLENAIGEKIAQRLHISVNENDVLPKSMCIICYSKLDKFDVFMKNVHEAQIRLSGLVRDEIERLSWIETQCSQKFNTNNKDSVISIDDSDNFEDESISDNEEKVIEDFEINANTTPNYSNKDQHYTTRYSIEKTHCNPQNEKEHDLRFKFVINEKKRRMKSTPGDEPARKSFDSHYIGNSLATDLNAIHDRQRNNATPKRGNSSVAASSLQSKDDSSVSCISSDNTTKGCERTIILSLNRRQRASWSTEQKSVMNQYFQNHWDSSTVPTSHECAQFIKEAGRLFHNKTGHMIRQYYINRRTRFMPRNE